VKVYYYIEPDEDSFPIGHYVTDTYILNEYFPYWYGKMHKAGKGDLVSFIRCIEDFCTINWAEELK